MNIHIIYFNFLDPKGHSFTVGGIQNYILNLLSVFNDLGLNVIIYQKGETNFTTEFMGTVVYGIKSSGNAKTDKEKLLNESLKNFVDGDILLYGCETMVVREVNVPTIAIQHGISWDVEGTGKFSKFRNALSSFMRYLGAVKIIRRVHKVDHLVCVDYNFLCWYRTKLAHPEVKISVIPNFASISNLNIKDNDIIRIIFARRFFPYRGTRIFGAAAKRILSEYNNVHITIAGSGPDQSYFENLFGNDKRVDITSYFSKDSLSIHADKNIAVIPTVGSEGTSLSLLEAMSAQCAVICTNVGGMTNIVIDGYNGLMISPNEEEIYSALKRLIEDYDLRQKLSKNAYETVCQGFSIDKWKDKWELIIKNTMKL